MPPHIHISALNGLIVFLYVVIGLAAVRIITSRFPDHPLAQALDTAT